MGVRSVLGFLLLISFSIIRTKGYALLVEEQPDYNVWDDEELSPQAEAEKIFSILCEKYGYSVNTEQIDCSNYQNADKDLLIDDNNHAISKREANDTDLLDEGSGDGEAAPDDVPAAEKPLETNNATNPVVEIRKNDEEPVDVENNGDEEKPGVDGKTTTKATDDSQSAVVDMVPFLGNNEKEEKSTNKTDDNPVVAESNGSQPENNEKEEKAAATTTPPQTDSNKLTTVLPPASSPKPEPEPAESDKKEAATPANESDSDKKEAAVDDKDSDKEEAAKPVAAQVPAETTEHPKQPEGVDDKQSNNAVIFKEPKLLAPVVVEGSDSEKHLASIASNAKLNDTELPTTGESSKNVAKAGKDTTILIVLFVVVIVIGAAAFTHNFIKKRKQRASENSELVNGIRRSLQNLTSGSNGKNSNDVEQGTEMKPLMKNNSPIVTNEYSDKKKEVGA